MGRPSIAPLPPPMSWARSAALRPLRDAGGRWLHALIDRRVAEKLARELRPELERIADESARRARAAVLEDLRVTRFPQPRGPRGGILPAADVETDVGRLYLGPDEADAIHELADAAAALRAAVEPGMTVLVIGHGSGTGYLVLVAAEAVGMEGRVVAAEKDPRALRLLRANVGRNALNRVETKPAEEDGVIGRSHAVAPAEVVIAPP